jgi:hypothetical protein
VFGRLSNRTSGCSCPRAATAERLTTSAAHSSSPLPARPLRSGGAQCSGARSSRTTRSSTCARACPSRAPVHGGAAPVASQPGPPRTDPQPRHAAATARLSTLVSQIHRYVLLSLILPRRLEPKLETERVNAVQVVLLQPARIPPYAHTAARVREAARLYGWPQSKRSLVDCHTQELRTVCAAQSQGSRTVAARLCWSARSPGHTATNTHRSE